MFVVRKDKHMTVDAFDHDRNLLHRQSHIYLNLMSGFLRLPQLVTSGIGKACI